MIGQNGNDGLHYEDDDTDFDIKEEQKEPNTDVKKWSVKEKIEAKADEQKKRKMPQGFQGYTITNHAQPINKS